jgi:hypothetical protein
LIFRLGIGLAIVQLRLQLELIAEWLVPARTKAAEIKGATAISAEALKTAQ